jgi:alpha-L-rhamnosidase
LPASARPATNDGANASCNHGFASHVVRWILRDFVGLYDVDPANRRFSLREPELSSNWASVTLPVAGGQLAIDWRREGEQMRFDVSMPEGFRRIDL